jgi:hypothetical protein
MKTSHAKALSSGDEFSRRENSAAANQPFDLKR